jgi:hypothetical protein
MDTVTEEYDPFEYEDCGECGKGLEGHDIIPISLGAYGGPYAFYRCKIPAS